MIISQNFLYLSVIFSYLLQELLDNYSEENGGLSQSHKSGTDQGGFIELTSHKTPKENVKSGCCSWSCVWLDAQWSGQGWGGCCQILLCVFKTTAVLPLLLKLYPAGRAFLLAWFRHTQEDCVNQVRSLLGMSQLSLIAMHLVQWA